MDWSLVDYCDVFIMLFGLSFWWHPFTAGDHSEQVMYISPKLFWWKKLTRLYLGCPERKYIFSKLSFLGYNMPLNWCRNCIIFLVKILFKIQMHSFIYAISRINTHTSCSVLAWNVFYLLRAPWSITPERKVPQPSLHNLISTALSSFFSVTY